MSHLSEAASSPVIIGSIELLRVLELLRAEGGLLWDRHWRRRLIHLDASRASGGLARVRRAIAGLGAAAAVFRDAALPPVEVSYRLALQGWLRAIAEGSAPLVPLRAGLQSLRVVEAAARAAREGRWVQIRPAKPAAAIAEAASA